MTTTSNPKSAKADLPRFVVVKVPTETGGHWLVYDKQTRTSEAVDSCIAAVFLAGERNAGEDVQGTRT